MRKRWITGITALLVLLLVYVFQHISYAHLVNKILPVTWSITNANAVFAINKVFRLLLNDLACVLLIHVLFKEARYVKAAFILFVAELFIILPLYLMVKLTLEGDSEISSPFLSQIHRMIVNPLLMFLLMAGFVYQRLIFNRAKTQ